MNASLYLLTMALSAGPYGQTHSTVYYPAPVYQTAYLPGSTPVFMASQIGNDDPLRGEPTVPEYTTDPNGITAQGGPTFPGNPQPYGAPNWDPTQAAPPQAYDPFQGPPPNNVPNVYQPRGAPAGGRFGAHGGQPYRLGNTVRTSLTFMPSEGVSGNPAASGRMGIFGLDTEIQNVRRGYPGWMFAISYQFGLRVWDGPTNGPVTAIGLPGTVYRFGIDLEWSTPRSNRHPWSYEFGFTPSINSDFQNGLSGRAWQWDARAIAYYQADPQLMFAFGVEYWDRVDNRVIPHVGFVYQPDDRWEYRIMFPESRISYFLGNDALGSSYWGYLRAEYHIEAYDIQRETLAGGRQDQIELRDWRFLFGVRKEHGPVVGFVELGWVFGREVEFRSATPGFDINTGFMGRIGLRF